MIKKYKIEDYATFLVFARKKFKLIEISPEISLWNPKADFRFGSRRNFRITCNSVQEKEELMKVFGKEFNVFEDVDGRKLPPKISQFSNDPSLSRQIAFYSLPGQFDVVVGREKFGIFLECLRELRRRQYRILSYLGSLKIMIR